MNHQITTKSSSSEVINTTSPISDISHNNSIALCESKHNKRLTECSYALYPLRDCLHGGGGPQVGEVTCLGGVK